MQVTSDVHDFLNILLPKLQNTLGENLVGVYLRGSLALGDFNPSTSDLDLLTVTNLALSEEEFVQVADIHAQLARQEIPYGRQHENAYLPREALKHYRSGEQHPTLYQGEALKWSEHQMNWVLERWTVREHGVTLVGPSPELLIDPITPTEIRDAVRVRLQDWVIWVEKPSDPDWQLVRGHNAYVIETMCRVLCTLATTEVRSKPASVEWARQHLPEPWCDLVRRSQQWRGDPTIDPELVEPVKQFVLWAAVTEYGQTS